MPPVKDNKWLAPLLITALVTVASAVSAFHIKAETTLQRANDYTDENIDNHLRNDLHQLSASKDTVHALEKDLEKIRNTQDKILDLQKEQAIIIGRIAEKVGVNK